MKPLAFIFTTCSLLLLNACRTQDKAGEQLEAYLSETYSLKTNDSTIYCFFPANQCRNCFLYNAAYISPEINKHTVIITGFDSANFKGFKQVLHDGNDEMMSLQALDYGNRIVLFRNGHIHRCLPVKDLYAQLDSIAHAYGIVKPFRTGP